MRKYIILCLILILASCYQNASMSEWQVVYENDERGEVMRGSKEKLINVLKNGAELRVGFGNPERTWHLTDANFISILDGEEVFAQVTRIVGQRPVRDSVLHIDFVTENRWTRIIGTNGFSTSYMATTAGDSTTHNVRDRNVSATWYVKQ